MFSFYAIFTKKNTYLIPTIMKNILLSTLFALITTLGFSQVPSYVPANGLVGWWPFNGNANDESGNGNNGTNNGATLTTDRNGVVDKAYSFDGIDDYIEVTNNAQVTLIGDLTMSAWVNTFGTNGQNYQTIISKRETYWTTEYAMILSYHSGVIHDTKLMTSRALGQGIQEQAWTNNPYSTMNWEFWTIVYSSGQVSLYKNGILDHSQPFTLIPSPQICPLLFGRNTLVDNSEQFFGKLDDIGIWNRALTDCEIQNLYTSTNPTNLTSQTSCDSYSWNGTIYTQSGVYTGPTANCVTESLNLTITPSSTNTTTASACDSYVWNGTTYTQSGVYTGTTANCVTESLNLTITPSSTITQPASQSTNISNNAQFIVGSSGSNAIYQWQTNLGFGFQNLNNAGQYNGTTSSTLSVINLSMSNNNQVFRCIISSGSCTDTSNVAVLTVANNAGINDLSASKLSIYPNPTNGDFTITGLELVGTVSSLSLNDMNGKVVKV
ncbi:MAG: LamG domain-containing protein, partial [Crocinitomicaceae bacterium]|nr:LamG domain-containing protein [Crocinitomicaceae bacterium]